MGPLPRNFFQQLFKYVTVTYKECGPIYPDTVCHIKSRDRSLVYHCSIQKSAKRGRTVHDEIPMESDNYADTHCFGANFRPIMNTRKTFNV